MKIVEQIRKGMLVDSRCTKTIFGKSLRTRVSLLYLYPREVHVDFALVCAQAHRAVRQPVLPITSSPPDQRRPRIHAAPRPASDSAAITK